MAQYAKYIDTQDIEYAKDVMVFDGHIYISPISEDVLKANGYKEVITAPTPSEPLEKDHHWETRWSNTAIAIQQVWLQVEDATTPPQRRQNAYETRKCIEFGDELITVDEARNICFEYMYDGTETAQHIIAELSVKIAEAKAAIREEYPDVNPEPVEPEVEEEEN